MVRSGQVSAEDVSQAREMYEIGMMPFIVATAKESDVKELEAHVNTMIAASTIGDFAGALEADYVFHATLFRVLDNPIINFTIDGLHRAIKEQVSRRRHLGCLAEIELHGGKRPEVFETDRVHQNIVTTLHDRDSVAATAAMTEHFDLQRRLLATYNESPLDGSNE